MDPDGQSQLAIRAWARPQVMQLPNLNFGEESVMVLPGGARKVTRVQSSGQEGIGVGSNGEEQLKFLMLVGGIWHEEGCEYG